MNRKKNQLVSNNVFTEFLLYTTPITRQTAA